MTTMTLTPFQFRECLAHICCMSEQDFADAFQDRSAHAPGDRPLSYQFRKFVHEYNRDAGRWVCYLDLGNLDALMTYLKKYFVSIGQTEGKDKGK